MGQSCSICSLNDESSTEQRSFDPPSKTANTMLTSKEPVFADTDDFLPKSCQNEQLPRSNGAPLHGHQVASRPLKAAAGGTAENYAKALLAPTLLDTTDPVLSITKAKEASHSTETPRKPPSEPLAAVHAVAQTELERKATEVGLIAAVSRSTEGSRQPPSKALAAAHAAHAELERKVENERVPDVSTEDSKLFSEAEERAVRNVLLGLGGRAPLDDCFAETGVGQALVCEEFAVGHSDDFVAPDTPTVEIPASPQNDWISGDEVEHRSNMVSEEALVCEEIAFGDSVVFVAPDMPKFVVPAFSQNARISEDEVDHRSSMLSEEVENDRVPCEMRFVEAPRPIWVHLPSVGTWVQQIHPVLLNSLDQIPATSSTEKTSDETFQDESFLIDGTASSGMIPTCQSAEKNWDNTFPTDGSPSSCMRPSQDVTLLLDDAPCSQLHCLEVTCGEKHCVEQASVADVVVVQSRWKQLPSVGTWLINSFDPDED